MDARCNGDVCDVLEMQTTEKAMECTVPRVVDEDIDGCEFFPFLTVCCLARPLPELPCFRSWLFFSFVFPLDSLFFQKSYRTSASNGPN
jgi:hypothetical protein